MRIDDPSASGPRTMVSLKDRVLELLNGRPQRVKTTRKLPAIAEIVAKTGRVDAD
jgi:hypothetical protein